MPGEILPVSHIIENMRRLKNFQLFPGICNGSRRILMFRHCLFERSIGAEKSALPV
jgi:hypothetical protein